MLKKNYPRDRKNRIIGSLTTGFQGSFETLPRDEHEWVIETSSERFQTVRDGQSKLLSINTADAGLLCRDDNDD